MKPLFILFLFSVSPFAIAIDVGDGSDGACTEASLLVGKRTYQCTTLTISAGSAVFKGAAGSSVLIKVQNDVNILNGNTVDVGGSNGIDGTTTAVTGGAGGAGGGAGGNSRLGLSGLAGTGSGAGTAGAFVANLGVRSYGGGGGGGSYKTVAAVVTGPSDGDDGGGGGTVPGTGGTNGSIYGSEATFEATFAGGSGGGAGGADVDGVTPMSGSSGGGGGGAIHIVAGGNITIDGTISANGGNGGGVGSGGGTGLFTSAGGAGSGGAIWLQAAGQLTVSVTGTISATGGTGGLNDTGLNGLGGDGGNGRIRLDDGDGVIANAGSVTPAPFSTTFTPSAATSGTTSIASRQYSSGISCARVSDNENVFIGNLLAGFMAIAALYGISKKRKV